MQSLKLTSSVWFTVVRCLTTRLGYNNKPRAKQPAKPNNTRWLTAHQALEHQTQAVTDWKTRHYWLTRDQDNLWDGDSSCSLLSVLSSVLLPWSSLFPKDLCLFITNGGAPALTFPTSGHSTGTNVFLLQIRMIMSPCHPESNLKYCPPNHLGMTLPGENTDILSGASGHYATLS